MSRTNLSLMGAYFAYQLHKLFGSKRIDTFEASEGLGHNFFSSKTKKIKGYVFSALEGGSTEKEYWVENLSDRIILTTTAMAHGDLTKRQDISTYRGLFNFEDIKRIVSTLQATKEYENKPIHLIIPRIETGAHEEHIVVEYRKIAANQRADQSQISLIIDSKPWPSGLLHGDIEERIHTEKQGLFNAEDCGYHVRQAVPVLWDLIKTKTPINAKNLLPALEKSPDGSYATRIAINKLHSLAEIYERRVRKNDEYHLTLGFFKFGCSATDKLNATKTILKNIENNEPNIFKGLDVPGKEKELEAANDSTLGKVVEEYLNSVSQLHPKYYIAHRSSI